MLKKISLPIAKSLSIKCEVEVKCLHNMSSVIRVDLPLGQYGKNILDSHKKFIAGLRQRFILSKVLKLKVS